MSQCIKDPRWEPMVVHSQTEMLRQRIYQIMAGFEDADDCDMRIYAKCYCALSCLKSIDLSGSEGVAEWFQRISLGRFYVQCHLTVGIVGE
ncbi:MAG: transposase [Bacteroidales bacterium]|nr:transposase [Candidatus Cryptobacteroides choladohippi]